jgi:hypothetical protein
VEQMNFARLPIDNDAGHNQVNQQVLVGTFTSVAKDKESLKKVTRL